MEGKCRSIPFISKTLAIMEYVNGKEKEKSSINMVVFRETNVLVFAKFF